MPVPAQKKRQLSAKRRQHLSQGECLQLSPCLGDRSSAQPLCGL